jgi:hypothetical protein
MKPERLVGWTPNEKAKLFRRDCFFPVDLAGLIGSNIVTLTFGANNSLKQKRQSSKCRKIYGKHDKMINQCGKWRRRHGGQMHG